MNSDADCSDDRIVLARRGALDDVQWRALMSHVRACAECRSVWLAAHAFDGEGRTESEDERLVDRAAMAALAAVAPPRARRIFRAAVIVAASLAGAAAMANVGIAIHQRRQAAAPGGQAPERQAARHARSIAGPATYALSEPPAPATSDSDGTPAFDTPLATDEASALAPGGAPGKTEHVRAVPPVPAGLLFARATAARRSGHLADAIAAFRQLQREHPRSAEAVVSLVSLGDLLSEGTEPTAGLALLDRYLDLMPGGPLAPEALACKVRALNRLGRVTEAQRGHDELVRRFPNWIYGQRLPQPEATP